MPHPRIHLRPPGTPATPDDGWQAWSEAWTRQMPRLTGRTDLTVVVAPGAGGGAPPASTPTTPESRSTPSTSGNRTSPTPPAPPTNTPYPPRTGC